LLSVKYFSSSFQRQDMLAGQTATTAALNRRTASRAGRCTGIPNRAIMGESWAQDEAKTAGPRKGMSGRELHQKADFVKDMLANKTEHVANSWLHV
jgi:hypothetical protein